MHLQEVQAIFPGIKSSHTLWTSGQRCSIRQLGRQRLETVARCHCELWRCPERAVPYPSVSALGENLPWHRSASQSGHSRRLLQVLVVHVKASFDFTSSQSERCAKPWQIPRRAGCKPAACWRKTGFREAVVKRKQQVIEHTLRLCFCSGFGPVWNEMCCGVFSWRRCSARAPADPSCCCHQLLPSIKETENFSIFYSHSTKAGRGLAELVMKL